MKLISHAIVVVLFLGAAAPAQTLTVSADHEDGVYDVGQTVEWRIHQEGPSTQSSVNYTLKRGGLTPIGDGTAAIDNGTATVRAKFDSPGTLLLEVKAGDQRGLGGAVAAPLQLKPSSPRPDDFDDFWAAKLRELEPVAPNPHLTEADSGKPGVQYFKITMDNVRGKRIQGQLARPASGEKFPAMFIPQWAGVYGLQKSWVTDRAAEGWLVLNIEPHDIPIDQPESFYKDQFAGPLKDYWSIGNDDRGASYYVPMYLSCYRAAEYLAHREDWDGKTLVAIGGSQGGQQALVTAAIHPKITAALAIVPAGCDMLGPKVGRAGGFPQWYDRTQGKDASKVHDASRYFDVVNFAPRIKCPVLIGAGLIDEICPGEGILVAANAITAPKEVITLPLADHQNSRDSHRAYVKRCWEVWLPALRQGLPAPVNQ
jgi:cephalosporin-C deacetylase-like acetyl esterase